VETLETYLEHARQAQTPIRLVLGGRYEEPVIALVRGRNGPTFDLVIGSTVLKMELDSIIVVTS
jgi:hypothetical protein